MEYDTEAEHIAAVKAEWDTKNAPHYKAIDDAYRVYHAAQREASKVASIAREEANKALQAALAAAAKHGVYAA